MASAQLEQEVRMGAPDRTPDQYFVFRGVDWTRYRALATAVGEQRVRLAYDGENLEIMTVSRLHDKISRLLGRLLVALTEELGVPIDSCGSTTLDREDVNRALEPDECFYLENEPRIRGRDEIDLAADPPPDLAVEVDVSRSSLDRLEIYARLGIPEVWRSDGQTLRVYQLDDSGRYVLTERSRHFPFLPVDVLAGFLQRRSDMDENSLVRLFREWLRERIARDWQSS